MNFGRGSTTKKICELPRFPSSARYQGFPKPLTEICMRVPLLPTALFEWTEKRLGIGMK